MNEKPPAPAPDWPKHGYIHPDILKQVVAGQSDEHGRRYFVTTCDQCHQRSYVLCDENDTATCANCGGSTRLSVLAAALIAEKNGWINAVFVAGAEELQPTTHGRLPRPTENPDC